MDFPLTEEQQDIIDTALSLPEDSIIKVEAVAGASKTFTSIKLAEALHGSNCLYLAYNKSIATEASTKFPKYVECKTTHSLAYYPVVIMGLDTEGNIGKAREIGWFNYRSIKENMKYDDKLLVIQLLDEFFLSKHIELGAFLQETELEVSPKIATTVAKYFNMMIIKEIPCTHAFYLKFYHILLATEYIHYDKPYDLLILDEAGDINAVTLEIFKLLPAKLKLMVGDSLQNIYSFNHTINGFKALKDIGETRYLTQSFRCSATIASQIQRFIHKHLDPDITFLGTIHDDMSINTKAILSRTNSGLIHYMIDLYDKETPFNLVRQAKEIFNLINILLHLNHTDKILDPTYRHLLKDRDTYQSSPFLQRKYKTLIRYIDELYKTEDQDITAAIKTIRRYSPQRIIDAYNFAKECEKSGKVYDITLSTAHSSKGLTFDEVTIADDFNLADVLETHPSSRTNEEVEELRLYYVACTRARVRLLNTEYL